MYTPNEIMFPHYVISQIKDARGPLWQDLVQHLQDLPQSHEEVLAFMLMMIRLNGCLECETDSYRAMRGCLACTLQTLRRSQATDEELLSLYHKCLHDVRDYAARNGASFNIFSSLSSEA